MKLYKSKPRYDTNTGEEISPVLSVCGAICDYDGLSIDMDNTERRPCYTISTAYDHSSEPLWYEDEERQILENKYGVGYEQYAKFMSSPYHFGAIECYGVSDASVYLIRDWMTAIKSTSAKKSKTIFDNCGTIEQAFHVARLRTLMKVLSAGAYTPTQLGLIV